MQVLCADCGSKTQLTVSNWHCECGGAWEPASCSAFTPQKIVPKYSIWRYGKFLGLDIESASTAMGVGWTPLVPVDYSGMRVTLKLEYLSPSGSFKDRGTNAMVSQLQHMSVKSVIEDSSGNAGASLAAHAARFGLKAKIFVPGYTSQAKKHQIAVYGAEVISIDGPRKAAEEAAQAAANRNQAYASHAYHPAYLAGQMTAAYELWEQLGRIVPDWIICPVAQGGQFLGFWFGFRHIYQAGLSDHMPRMVAVQSKNIAPIYHAWRDGLDTIPEVEVKGRTIAEGVAIAKPVRGKRLLQAMRETDLKVVVVDEGEILAAQMALGHLGYYIEPTSAVAAAGLKNLQHEIQKNELVILPLTGNGLKGVPKRQ